MKLTDKERLVLACLIDGNTDKQIAENTGISIRVVRTHLMQSIFRKLGVGNRTQAAVFAWKHGLDAEGIQRNGHRSGLIISTHGR